MGRFRYLNKGCLGMMAGIIVVTILCSSVWATHSLPGSGWIMITDDDGDTGSTGGQAYDHEYMAWKLDGSLLSIGVQSGFNVVTGNYNNYYLGDLALSFDGDTTYDNRGTTTVDDDITGYEYAFDYGLFTKDNHRTDRTVDADTDGLHGGGDGVDSVGLWDVTTWNNHNKNNTFSNESPFAMDGGSEVLAAIGSTSAGALGSNSYYRIATFDISALAGLEDVIFNPNGSLTVDAHISMSCGNDVMTGRFKTPETGQIPPNDAVPEPSTIALLGVGLVGLAGGAARRRMKKKKEEK